jgi:small subunit ribosomal protein S1
VSDISWTKKVTHPNEVFKKGDKVKCVVLDVDQEKQRVALGLKQLTEDPWLHAIPDAYKPGMVVRGKVTKITNFGVFVELENDLEGLLHISELADHKVENPQDVVKPGEEVDVKILRVDIDDRKIGLSLKRAQWGDTDRGQSTEGEEKPEKVKKAPKRGGIRQDHVRLIAEGARTHRSFQSGYLSPGCFNTRGFFFWRPDDRPLRRVPATAGGRWGRCDNPAT